MKFSGKRTGYALLAVAYVLSAILVFRHVSRSAEPGRVTIRVCQWQLETGVREAFDAMIRRYEQINPRVHVVQIAVPGGPLYTSWVLTQMVGGTGPDLVQYTWNAPDIPRMFQPITADVEKPNPYNKGTPLEGVPWRDTFIDGMTSPDAYIDSLHQYYSVALDTHLGRIVYNKPLLKRITGSDQPPTTYRGMLAICAQIRAYAAARGLNLMPVTNSHDTNELQCWLISMAMTNRLGQRIDFQHRLKIDPDEGGQDYLRGEWNFDTPEVAATVRELKEYGAMCNPGFWERERDTAVTDFVCERAVMIVAPSWEATNLLGLCHFEIAAFPYPYPAEDDPVYGPLVLSPFSEGQVTTGLPIYLNRTTQHRAEAIDFLHFITSQEGSSIFTRVSNWPPATIGVEPSSFAAQFKLLGDGYQCGINILLPTAELNSMGYTFTHMSDIWSANGTAEAFSKAMKEGLGDAIRQDLIQNVITGLDNLRRVDVEAAISAVLAPPGGRPEALPLISVTVEGGVYQNAALTAMTNQALPVPAQDGPPDLPFPAPAPGPAGPQGAARPGDPGLAAAWADLRNLHADRALPVFEGKSASSDAAVARDASLGLGLALLDKQPVSPSQIERARAVFEGLAAGGDDDAQAARFFLGRIAQHHQDVADPARAAAEYRRLILEHPGSMWAQAALTRLALIDIYSLGRNLAPAARVARAARLLAYARTPSAASDLHAAIASAIFFYRLPASGALPHLVAAVDLGRLDWPVRRDMLVQIAELSRLAGDREQAVRYYRIFLKENPIDVRVYAVKKILASLGKA